MVVIKKTSKQKNIVKGLEEYVHKLCLFKDTPQKRGLDDGGVLLF